MRTVEGKVVVLGDRGVGKSSFLLRYLKNEFNHHISPTIGANFLSCNLNVEDTRVKLKIWDTAGQERFRSLANMYYRNSNAALIVFDITRRETFTSVKHWVNELKGNIEEPIVMCLVGNKTDLDNQRQVTEAEAVDYVNSIDAAYYETSVLQDHGIRDVFMHVAGSLLNLSRSGKSQTLVMYEKVDEKGNPILITPYAPEWMRLTDATEPERPPPQCCSMGS